MIKFNPDEKIILELRRHRFVLYSEFGKILFFIVLPLLIYIIAGVFFGPILEAPLRNLFFLFYFLYLLFFWAYFFIIWIDYYLDVWIVTNERIIDIELLGLFQREFSEFKLSRVQDVTVEVNGVLPTLLNFGNVHIQTAGEAREFLFKQVPYPYEAKKIILDAYDKYMNHKLGYKNNYIEGH